FTRANPAADIYGIGAFTQQKHWGCTGPLVIDARLKPHHAPPLIADPQVSKRIDALAARGGTLAKWLCKGGHARCLECGVDRRRSCRVDPAARATASCSANVSNCGTSSHRIPSFSPSH